MSSSAEGSGSRSGDAGLASNMLAVIGCCLPLLAVLVGGGSLVAHYLIRTPTSPYQVEFSTSGAVCGSDGPDDSGSSDGAEGAADAELVLDEETGEVLYCSVLPPIDVDGRARARGAFSAEEVARVTDLARSRAADGRLEEADRDAVERLVAEIGREHGETKTSPTPLERLTWTVGLYGLVGGLAALVLLGLVARYLDL
ncbi:hypothetical protein [Streptomyces sp. B6B3]|uniref:hypothetical protein n=1 Tax=Streptomyces sp. B6B3 TaxID=3153570 RepID=UPI00325C8EEA